DCDPGEKLDHQLNIDPRKVKRVITPAMTAHVLAAEAPKGPPRLPLSLFIGIHGRRPSVPAATGSGSRGWRAPYRTVFRKNRRRATIRHRPQPSSPSASGED